MIHLIFEDWEICEESLNNNSGQKVDYELISLCDCFPDATWLFDDSKLRSILFFIALENSIVFGVLEPDRQQKYKRVGNKENTGVGKGVWKTNDGDGEENSFNKKANDKELLPSVLWVFNRLCCEKNVIQLLELSISWHYDNRILFLPFLFPREISPSWQIHPLYLVFQQQKYLIRPYSNHDQCINYVYCIWTTVSEEIQHWNPGQITTHEQSKKCSFVKYSLQNESYKCYFILTARFLLSPCFLFFIHIVKHHFFAQLIARSASL